MARLSKEERAELEARLKADDEADDYDPEVEVRHSDGSSERLPYSLARKHHPDRFKDPEPPQEPKEPKEPKGDGGTRFAGRRVS